MVGGRRSVPKPGRPLGAERCEGCVGDWVPYGAPITFFRSIGDEIDQALDPVVTALTGVSAKR
ncbi:hypothetical protein GGE06_003930 [Streptomyces sp. SFB5A]|uniref:Uncharacterized protein n=1 Tax=Streptomyces nymphaeiformis TaxID=2663842 RepID=A0A7W7XDA0_9ACTN|nr:hypothetical protein [Streptomyces nymphaeiformis]